MQRLAKLGVVLVVAGCGRAIDGPTDEESPALTTAADGGCPTGSVWVAASEDLQAKVLLHDAGTVFCLLRGEHHDRVLSLKSGDVFTSPSGTTADGVVENGSMPLTRWTPVMIGTREYWTTPGGKPVSPSYDSTKCEAAFPSCFYPQNLYVEDADYLHVASLAQLGAGRWFYDYDGGVGPVDNVYLSENPTGRKVELGVLDHAFQSTTADRVTVQGLIVEKYASRIGEAAVEAWAPDWLIQHNEARLNHGIGLGGRPGCDGVRILHNSSHDNGQMGIGGGRMNHGRVSYNTLVHNNIDHTLAGFGAGGFKFGGTSNIVVSHNLIHDNLAQGLHADAYSDQVTFEDNTVHDNLSQGIRVEISDHATISGNTVFGNGAGSPDEPGMRASQIGYAASSHGSIRNNVVAYGEASGGGIQVGYNLARGGCDADGGCTVPVGMSVTGNRIYLSGTLTAAELLDSSDAGEGRTTAAEWIVPGIFAGNTYCVSALPYAGSNWLRSTPTRSYANDTFGQWQDAGQDLRGTLSAECASAP